jgi:hypothetical protein
VFFARFAVKESAELPFAPEFAKITAIVVIGALAAAKRSEDGSTFQRFYRRFVPLLDRTGGPCTDFVQILENFYFYGWTFFDFHARVASKCLNCNAFTCV